jgi:hypothetical protein
MGGEEGRKVGGREQEGIEGRKGVRNKVSSYSM